jgi:hypothetical protein
MHLLTYSILNFKILSIYHAYLSILMTLYNTIQIQYFFLDAPLFLVQELSLYEMGNHANRKCEGGSHELLVGYAAVFFK